MFAVTAVKASVSTSVAYHLFLYIQCCEKTSAPILFIFLRICHTEKIQIITLSDYKDVTAL